MRVIITLPTPETTAQYNERFQQWEYGARNAVIADAIRLVADVVDGHLQRLATDTSVGMDVTVRIEKDTL